MDSTSQYLSVAVSLLFLTIAAYYDFRTREVSDKVWATYAPIGAALTIYRTYLQPSLLIITAASIALSTLIALGLVFFGLSGGADAKALICLGLTLPIPPSIMPPILGFVHPFFPLVVLVTAYIVSLSVSAWMLGKNLLVLARQGSAMFGGLEREPTWKKGLALITGFPTRVSVLLSTFYLYPMEKVIEDKDGARRTFQFFSNADVDREQVLSEFFKCMEEVGLPNTVWVTPGLPLLAFMLFGLVIGVTIGDPLLFGIRLLTVR